MIMEGIKQIFEKSFEFQQLKEKLISAIPYISYELNKKISKFNLDMDDDTIVDLKKALNNEIDNYKYNQYDSFSHANEKSIQRIFEYQYKTK